MIEEISSRIDDTQKAAAKKELADMKSGKAPETKPAPTAPETAPVTPVTPKKPK